MSGRDILWRRERSLFFAGRDLCLHRGWCALLVLGMRNDLAKPYMDAPAVFSFRIAVQRIRLVMRIDGVRYYALRPPFRMRVYFRLDLKLLRHAGSA